MKSKQFKRSAIWCVMQAGFLVLMWRGLFMENRYAANGFWFAFWLQVALSIVGIITASTDAALKAKWQNQGRSVPAWLAIGTDLIVLSVLAITGRFTAASFQFVAIMCESALFTKEEEKEPAK